MWVPDQRPNVISCLPSFTDTLNNQLTPYLRQIIHGESDPLATIASKFLHNAKPEKNLRFILQILLAPAKFSEMKVNFRKRENPYMLRTDQPSNGQEILCTSKFLLYELQMLKVFSIWSHPQREEIKSLLKSLKFSLFRLKS